MRARIFAATVAYVATMLVTAAGVSAADADAKPNVLIIITDQQFADAMSCAVGRRYLHTPNMDALAETGMRFTRAYCANPLCVPSRTAMFSGRYPHETGVQTNDRTPIDPARFPDLGRWFQAAGYETGYFGKWHMPYQQKLCFETCEKNVYSGEPAARFIRAERDRPFLAVASFMNPHNICEWSRGQRLPGGSVGEPPPPEACPPLLPNLAPPRHETDIMTHMRKAYQGHRLFPVGHFTEDKWRQYRWAYYRLVEKVDRHVGTVLDALRQSGREENTVVVFLSDHGECHGVHGWNQKTVFYDEAARVPLIIRQKGTTPAGTCDALASTGVDLMPTLCDFAGIDPPPGLPGRSLKPDALGKPSGTDGDYVVVENHLVQCVEVGGVMLKPQGRMVRSQRYKYCIYDEGKRCESLVDMQHDPGETNNLAADPEARDVLLQHRGYLQEFAKCHNDGVALGMLEAVNATKP